MDCVSIGFGLCYTPKIFLALIFFLLAALAWGFFNNTPQPYFHGDVTVRLERNHTDFSETVIIVFNKTGRYHISFDYPHLINGPQAVGLNHTRLVKMAPETATITEKWFPKPLKVTIEHEYRTETHRFN